MILLLWRIGQILVAREQDPKRIGVINEWEPCIFCGIVKKAYEHHLFILCIYVCMASFSVFTVTCYSGATHTCQFWGPQVVLVMPALLSKFSLN